MDWMKKAQEFYSGLKKKRIKKLKTYKDVEGLTASGSMEKMLKRKKAFKLKSLVSPAEGIRRMTKPK